MLKQGLMPGKAPYGYRNIIREDKKKWVVTEPYKAKIFEKMYECF